MFIIIFSVVVIGPKKITRFEMPT